MVGLFIIFICTFHLIHFIIVTEVNGVGKTQAGSECLWCGQTGKPNSYVLQLKNGRKAFCSEACLFEFRKGACIECGDAIRGQPFQITSNSVIKDFCSEVCLNRYQNKDKIKQNEEGDTKVTPKHSAILTGKSPNGSSITSPAQALQSPFSWDEYLAETGSTAAPHSCFKQVLASSFIKKLVVTIQQYFYIYSTLSHHQMISTLELNWKLKILAT